MKRRSSSTRRRNPKRNPASIIRQSVHGAHKRQDCELCGEMGPDWSASHPKSGKALAWARQHVAAHKQYGLRLPGDENDYPNAPYAVAVRQPRPYGKRKNPVIRTLRATVAERVARAKREILADCRPGHPVGHGLDHLPRHAIKSFADLHDYVDANGYGGFFEDKGAKGEKWGFRGSQQDVNAANAVQDELDAWIKAGGLRPKSRTR